MNEQRYWELHREAVAASAQARFGRAEELFGEASREARHLGLSHLADRAACNRAAIALERGDASRNEELSRILGASTDLKARQLAAYSLGNAYRNMGKLSPAQFYGRISVRLARRLGQPASEASCLHFLGLTNLGRHEIAEARRNLEESVEIRLAGPGSEVERERIGVTLSALGYCRSLEGDFAAAEEALRASAEAFDASPTPLYAPAVHLNFGFASLEMGDLERAARHGQAALDLEGRSDGLGVDLKYAYYLVGEVCVRRGREGEARGYFESLRRSFYPALSSLPDFLLACDTHRLVNWLA